MPEALKSKGIDLLGRNRGWLYLIIGTTSFYIGSIYWMEEWEPVLLTAITLIISFTLIPISIFFGILNIFKHRVINGLALIVSSIFLPLLAPIIYLLPQFVFIFGK
jgi:hypothetical protein